MFYAPEMSVQSPLGIGLDRSYRETPVRESK